MKRWVRGTAFQQKTNGWPSLNPPGRAHNAGPLLGSLTRPVNRVANALRVRKGDIHWRPCQVARPSLAANLFESDTSSFPVRDRHSRPAFQELLRQRVDPNLDKTGRSDCKRNALHERHMTYFKMYLDGGALTRRCCIGC